MSRLSSEYVVRTCHPSASRLPGIPAISANAEPRLQPSRILDHDFLELFLADFRPRLRVEPELGYRAGRHAGGLA